MSNNTVPPPAVKSQGVGITPNSLAKAVEEGLTVKEIARRFGVTYSLVYRRIQTLGLQAEYDEKRYTDDPSPEEIEERSREVRSKWSPEETLRRMGANAPRGVYYDRRGMVV